MPGRALRSCWAEASMTESPIAVTCRPWIFRGPGPLGLGAAAGVGDWPGVGCACPPAFPWAWLDRVAALILSPRATCCIRPDRSLRGGRRTPYPAVHATVAAATVARTGSARMGERRAAVTDSASIRRQVRNVALNPSRMMGVSIHFHDAAA